MNNKWLTKIAAGALALCSFSGSVYAAPHYGEDRRWFLNFMAGGASAVDNDFDSGPQAAFGIGKPFAKHFAWEVLGSYLDLEANSGGAYQRTAIAGGLMMFPRAAFVPERNRIEPYFGVYATLHNIEFANVESQNFGADLAVGLLYRLGRVDVRAELRHQVDEFEITVPGFEDESFQTTAGLVGVRVPMGPTPKPLEADEDFDGVPDRIDKCLNTPIGVAVDIDGCPVDLDGDGIPDFIDKCPNTPKGVRVNANGCSLDDDRDGVPNDYDQCPETPLGARVNSDGCALDSDGDNVPDGIDACPATQAGVKVDDHGCGLDNDADGVPNKIDACPGTLAGARVNSQGCVISQNVELRGVHFEFDKDRLMLDSKSVLLKVAESLKNEPTVQVVVEGHTDALGSNSYNQHLSEKRAQAVAAFLVANGISRNRIKAVGYGEANPVASNETEDGRERNRRVELKLSAK